MLSPCMVQKPVTCPNLGSGWWMLLVEAWHCLSWRLRPCDLVRRWTGRCWELSWCTGHRVPGTWQKSTWAGCLGRDTLALISVSFTAGCRYSHLKSKYWSCPAWIVAVCGDTTGCAPGRASFLQPWEFLSTTWSTQWGSWSWAALNTLKLEVFELCSMRSK